MLSTPGAETIASQREGSLNQGDLFGISARASSRSDTGTMSGAMGRPIPSQLFDEAAWALLQLARVS